MFWQTLGTAAPRLTDVTKMQTWYKKQTRLKVEFERQQLKKIWKDTRIRCRLRNLTRSRAV